jgi:hypothetical protein
LALHLAKPSCSSAAAAGSANVAAVKAASEAIFSEFFINFSWSTGLAGVAKARPYLLGGAGKEKRFASTKKYLRAGEPKPPLFAS